MFTLVIMKYTRSQCLVDIFYATWSIEKGEDLKNPFLFMKMQLREVAERLRATSGDWCGTRHVRPLSRWGLSVHVYKFSSRTQAYRIGSNWKEEELDYPFSTHKKTHHLLLQNCSSSSLAVYSWVVQKIHQHLCIQRREEKDIAKAYTAQYIRTNEQYA